jgi:hypothetical protein
MSGLRIKTYQLQVYRSAREMGMTQTEASTIAGFSERSAQRIEAGDHQPNRGDVRTGNSSTDPLAGVWENELEPMLRVQPGLQPMTLFEYLQERYPGAYPQVLRTLQRRVQTWKALHGEAPEVMFELRHEPGGMGISDFTELKGIEITINGRPFEHLLYHYRLAYSGWQYAQIIQGGESFVALSEGLQNALAACGGAPLQHRTDSLSAAYRNRGRAGNKPLTHLYEHLCEHYRLQPTRNNKGIAHENGAIESPHGHLKRRIEQALLLRGSYNFECMGDYQALIHQCADKLNVQHQAKYEEEKRHLQALPIYRVADYEVLNARVSSRSTIEVRCVLYSVPARLIGRNLELHLYHDRLVGYVAHQRVVELPRVRPQPPQRRARCIDYRHVVESLRRKPRAFIYSSWQQDLLPNDEWRALWQQMKAQFELDSAAVLMVEALYIAATQAKQTVVAEYLYQHLAAQTLSLLHLRRQFQIPTDAPLPPLTMTQHELTPYDQLLHPTNSHPQSLSEPQPLSQTTASESNSDALGKPGTPSDAGKLVLRSVPAGSVRIRGESPLHA